MINHYVQILHVLFNWISSYVFYVLVLSQKVVIKRTWNIGRCSSIVGVKGSIHVCNKSKHWTCNAVVWFCLVSQNSHIECSGISTRWMSSLPNMLQHWYFTEGKRFEDTFVNLSPFPFIYFISSKELRKDRRQFFKG